MITLTVNIDADEDAINVFLKETGFWEESDNESGESGEMLRDTLIIFFHQYGVFADIVIE